MAYPFIKFPTFGEFRDRAVKEYGCQYRRINDAKLVDQSGNAHDLFEFVREVEGKKLFVSPQNLTDETVLTPSVLRSLCARLRIPVEDFGMTLG